MRKNSKRRKLNISLVTGLILVGIFFLIMLASFFWLPADSTAMNAAEKFQSPSLKHLFGTDSYGRDVFARTIAGLKTTFFIAGCTVLIGAGVGTFVGGITGYFGGWLDEVLMRLNDAIASFPSTLVAMVMVCLMGTGKLKLILIMGLVFVPSFARVMRSEFIRLKSRDYVSSAKLMGCSSFRIIFVHIFPNTRATILSSIAIGFNNAVLTEAALSYLGIGVQPPEASLGKMLAESQGYYTKLWCVLGPGTVLIFLILGVVLLSEGLADSHRKGIDISKKYVGFSKKRGDKTRVKG